MVFLILSLSFSLLSFFLFPSGKKGHFAVLNIKAFANILNVHSHIEYRDLQLLPFNSVYACICSASRSDSFYSNSTKNILTLRIQ